ncbi:hypothetical protein VNO77_15994 [Canavalia gladiata]|uniref:Uncharacterized protein n=1 Tax=Canavalia gladiata TaxID=3824 RepID=A0AAN9LZM6_CANGL
MQGGIGVHINILVALLQYMDMTIIGEENFENLGVIKAILKRFELALGLKGIIIEDPWEGNTLGVYSTKTGYNLIMASRMDENASCKFRSKAGIVHSYDKWYLNPIDWEKRCTFLLSFRNFESMPKQGRA